MSASSIVPSCSCVWMRSALRLALFLPCASIYAAQSGCRVCAPEFESCAVSLGQGRIQPSPSDSQEVTLGVLSRAVDEQRGHVARSTAREMPIWQSI